MKTLSRVEKYGRDVWSNVEMDNLRKEECLCLNCIFMKVCFIAHKFYEICKEDDVALMVTRCPVWRGKDDQSEG